MLQVHLKCPAHPHYDPFRRGEGGIKGGCIWCSKLYQLWLEIRALEKEMQNADWRRRIDGLTAKVPI